MKPSGVRQSAQDLVRWIAQALRSCGVSDANALVTATALVEADLQGVSSHGCMLVPMYIDRLRAGSVKAQPQISILDDKPGFVILDADHGLGQVSSVVATDLVIERARTQGSAIVVVRHGFHFGTAAFWSARIAKAGLIGGAMSNTRPLMPAPGGAERVVGNNPLSFAFPSKSDRPVIVDMATSNSAMGRIRNAEREGLPIPEGWATNKDGQPTTSATEAISGMLLPAAGPKGFGLAVMIDLLCGGLSGGGVGSKVQPLYGPSEVPYNCSHWFMAIDAGQDFGFEADAFGAQIRNAAPASGRGEGATVYAPGDLERERRTLNDGHVTLSEVLIGQFETVASTLNIPFLNKS